jgi:hypothetical protein
MPIGIDICALTTALKHDRRVLTALTVGCLGADLAM